MIVFVLALGMGMTAGAYAGGCPAGEIEDCCGNCAPATWVGDAFCDDGSFVWSGNPIFLNCEEHNCDGGDCPVDCDFTPDQCPAELLNDDCEDRIVLTDGDTEFSTVGATTDGPALPPECDKGFGLFFGQDIWYNYTPTASGLVSFSTCNQATYDTRMAIYEGCDCETFNLVGCNDDGPGCAGFTSLLEVELVEGQCYKFRLGGYDTAVGTGTLTVTSSGPPPVECPDCEADLDESGSVGVPDLLALLACWGDVEPGSECECADFDDSGAVGVPDLLELLAQWGECPEPPVCGPGAGDCCSANGTVGCENEECCETVCAADPFCCETEWDSICADEAAELCGDLCVTPGACGPDAGDCCSANGSVGCNDPDCCNAVCECDPFCCETEWDAFCATTGFDADCLCGPGSCGAQNTPECDCEIGKNPACNEEAGDCCSANGTPGCNDATCCNQICAADPFCCDVSWDGICAGAANSQCEVCMVPCKGEPPANDLCENADFAPDPLSIGDSHTFVGEVNECNTLNCASFPGFPHGWIAFELAEDASVSLEYCGSDGVWLNAWLNLALGCPCTGFTAGASFGFTCPDGNLQMNWATLAAGTYYYPVMYDPANGSAGNYNITVSVSDGPPPPAGCGDAGAGDCCSANGTPGCDDQECCDAVCACDPFCCNTAWDEFCATTGFDADCLCGPGTCGALNTPECECGGPPPVECDCQDTDGTPGCAENLDCEACVCGLDAFCCDTEWDGICAEEAAVDCADVCCEKGDPGACGAGAGDCCSANGSVGCEDEACCNAVCACDPFCCETEWDNFCATTGFDADCLCGPGSCGAQNTPECGCGDPGPPAACNPDAGDCCTAGGNGTPGCNDEACCAATCAADPFCCNTSWDGICADAAIASCAVCGAG